MSLFQFRECCKWGNILIVNHNDIQIKFTEINGEIKEHPDSIICVITHPKHVCKNFALCCLHYMHS